MRQYDIELDNYQVTQSEYFRLATTVALGMVIVDGDLLYCHGVAKINVDKKILALQYNNRTVYYCFNNTFTDEFGSQKLHLPPITIDDIPCSNKLSVYTLNLIPAATSIASKNYVSTLTTPSDSPDLLPSDDPNTLHVMKKYVPFQGRFH